MKNENPIEEIWRIREEIGAEHGYDVDRLFDAMRGRKSNTAPGWCAWCRAARRRNPQLPCAKNRRSLTDAPKPPTAGKHCKRVPPEEITAADLQSYQQRAPD